VHVGSAGFRTWLLSLHRSQGDDYYLIKALFSLQKILARDTVALSFVCGKYYPIID